MKQTIFGIVAALFVLSGIVISLTLYGRETRRSELDAQMSAAMKQTMKEVQAARVTNEDEMAAAFLNYLLVRLDAKSELTVNLLEVDATHGLLRAEVVETYKHPTGQTGQVSCEKTIVLDENLQEEKPQKFTIRFYTQTASGKTILYKTYQLQEKDPMPQPKDPVCEGAVFQGWRTKAGENVTLEKELVTQNQTLYAWFD